MSTIVPPPKTGRKPPGPPPWAADLIAWLAPIGMRLASISPVLWFEFVTGSRRSRWIWVRGAYCFALFLALMHTYRAFGFRRGVVPLADIANLSTMFFEKFAFLQLALAMFAAPGVVAGSLAQERERRTIEYLFASPLSTLEIVLGKLVARLALLSLMLSAGFPVLMLALPMGGVEPRAVALTFWLTAAALVASTGVSILVSAASANARDALLRSYVALAAWLVALPLARIAAVLALGDPPKAGWRRTIVQAFDWLVERNPFVALANLMAGPEGGSGTAAATLVGQVVRWQIVAGVCGIVLAGFLVRRIHLHEWGGRSERAPVRRLQRLERHFARRPVAWKEMFLEQSPLLGRRISIGLAVATGLVALIVFWLGLRILLVPSRTQAADEQKSFVLLSGVAGIACGYYGIVVVLVRAATSIPREKERNCWETLISTTLSAVQIVRGKFWGALYAARFPALAAGYFLAAPVCISPLYYIMAWTYFCAAFIAMACLAGVAGIYFSLYFKSLWQAHVASGALAAIMLVICSLLMLPLNLAGATNASIAVGISIAPCCAAPALTLVVSLALGLYNASVQSFDTAVERRPRKVVS